MIEGASATHHLEPLLHLSDDCIIILDAHYHIMAFNEAAQGLLRWQSNMLGKAFAEIYQEGSLIQPFPLPKYLAILKGKLIPFSCVFHQDESKRYIRWKFEYSSNQSQLFILGKDITDKKRLSLHNVTMFDQIKKISACVPGNFYWKNKNEEYLGCNETLLQALGFNSLNDIVGKTDRDLWPLQAKELRKNDQAVIRAKKPVFFEEEVTLDGKKRYFTAIKMPLIDDEGKIIGILGNSLDITELKNTQADLKIAKELAEKASQAKTEFIANMSHDIRTPLTGIIGMSKMLEEKAVNQEEKQYAGWVNDSGKQLLKLLNGVIEMVSAEHMNEDDLHLETVNLQECLDELYQLEKPAFLQNNIIFELAIDSKIPTLIQTDRIKLSRILLNLLGNAIKFTNKGSIKLSVNLEKLSSSHNKLHFRVADTGKGIPKEDQDKVFERFYRVSPSYKNAHHGHGVGLHIVEKYVELLGGEIGLESEEGKGSCFFFSIPLLAGQPSVATPDEEIRQDNSVNYSFDLPFILLVEDNEIALRVVEGMVTKAGCSFLSATSGEEGLQLAKTTAFDLIITDIGLPGISGWEMAQQIRQWEQENKQDAPPVLIYGLTGHALESSKEELCQSGMNGLFTKPINSTTLEKLLHSISFKAEMENKNSLGLDLPETEEKLFLLDCYPLLNSEEGIINLGSEAILRELLTSMLTQELPDELLRLQEAYELSDWNKVEALAHKIKSAAIYCGTIRLKFACQYLERYRKAGYHKQQEQLYCQLIQIAEETKQAISQWLIEKTNYPT